MSSVERYREIVLGVVNGVLDDEKNKDNIEKAAEMIAESSIRDELIYIVGPGGHSTMTCEECMCRTGVLANINPMLDVTNLLNGTTKSRILQRNPSYAAGVLDSYYVPEGAVLIINNAYGINALTVGIALEAKKRGIKTIGISSPEHSAHTPKGHAGRHPSDANLCDIVDVSLDNHMPYGDAIIDIKGCDQPIGPVSTIASVFTLECVMVRAIELIVEKGGDPDVWRSYNVPGGDEYDKHLFEKYGCRVKYLL